MAELVMLACPPGPGFVESLLQTWEAGDAVFPLDTRLPRAEADRIIAVVRPTAVIEADGERRTLDDGEPVASGDAAVVATSGTSGEPKAVIHTHASLEASSWATSRGVAADPASDCWLACLPPAHIGGLAVITRAIHTGTALVALERFDPVSVDAAARDGATLASVVTRALTQIDASGFRCILIGGAAPPPDLPAHVIPTYGMTETGSGCVYGGYPLDGVELRANDGGEIEVRAPLLLRAYRTADGEVDPRRADGWFATGDVGQIAADGRLSIDGRAGQMIISGGQNIHPHRVEHRLEAHPAIDEAAVIGRPDAEWGQRLVALLVCPGKYPGLDEVRDWVKRDLPAWYAPRELEFRAALPKTALGKVRRNEL